MYNLSMFTPGLTGQQVPQAPQTIPQIIASVAQKWGVNPLLAIATAMKESGLDPTNVGDGGTSFGLFQLHQGGELGSLTPQQAFDPYTNANVAISTIAQVQAQHPNWSPGQIAAAAQRPAHPGSYAQAVDNIYNKLTNGDQPVAQEHWYDLGLGPQQYHMWDIFGLHPLPGTAAEKQGGLSDTWPALVVGIVVVAIGIAFVLSDKE